MINSLFLPRWKVTLLKTYRTDPKDHSIEIPIEPVVIKTIKVHMPETSTYENEIFDFISLNYRPFLESADSIEIEPIGPQWFMLPYWIFVYMCRRAF